MEAKSLDPSKTQLQKIFDLVSRGQFEEVLNQTASALESFPGSWRLYNVQALLERNLVARRGSSKLSLALKSDQNNQVSTSIWRSRWVKSC